ncbi:methyltransferase domain-containing protein [Rutstroemia sp. NJR-2017a BVV2]|nr:methyltransferase domain-containing protein [Rutstroemia sp. NJR-2017a BVV2]
MLEHAANYDARFQKTIDQLTSLLRAPSILSFINIPWLPESDSDTDTDTSPQHTLKLLDYACGTGLITRAFLPYVSRAIGVDLSPEMVAVYNAHAHNQGLGREEMCGVVGNLLEGGEGRLEGDEEGNGEFFDFDVAVVGLGFHHFADARLAAKRLGERLKKGGVLVVVDFESHEPVHGGGHGHSHGHSHGHGHEHSKEKEEEQEADVSKQVKETITHHGFSEEEIRSIFEDAGVGAEFGYRVLGKGIVFHGTHGDGKGEGERKEMRRGVFIARGTKV